MLYPQEDFRKLNQGDVSKIAGLLNERPRKTLDFRTPYEVFSKLRQELPSAFAGFSGQRPGVVSGEFSFSVIPHIGTFSCDGRPQTTGLF
jgi:hypothetical protein